LNLIQAKKVALEIEKDIAVGLFDSTLGKYKLSNNKKPVTNKTVVEYFEEWTSTCRQMDCEKDVDYHALRNTIQKWGKVTENNLLAKLSAQKVGTRTFNRRLTMLRNFARWMVSRLVWKINPLEEVKGRKEKKVLKTNRKPFTQKEIKTILDAFKNNSCSPKSSRYSHSHYYSFIYFIFKTGVRNSEAIGLRVGSVDFEKKVIHIREVLARTLKGTNASARVRKETKNGKERVLPLTKDLELILEPLCACKKIDDLVFTSFTGLAIDDRMFQRRVFKPILYKLGIEERVLYACRHTFGSRCIDEGITPVMTAFLMGNNPETALRNYTHQVSIPIDLPGI